MEAQDPKDQWCVNVFILTNLNPLFQTKNKLCKWGTLYRAMWVHKVKEATLDPLVHQDHREALVNLASKDSA